MVTFTYTDEYADDAALSELYDAVASTYGYRAEILDTSTPESRRARVMLPNPETKAEFAAKHLKLHLAEIVRNYKRAQQLAGV